MIILRKIRVQNSALSIRANQEILNEFVFHKDQNYLFLRKQTEGNSL